MGKSSAPEPTNPVMTAAASNSTNIGTAVANAMMGNVNQVTPNGSLTYDQTGTHEWKDPFTGQTYKVPTFTATQQLSPTGQKIQDQNQQAQLNLAGIAADRSGFLKNYLGNAVDTSGLPGLATNAGQSAAIGNGYNSAFNPSVGDGYDNAFSRSIGNGYNAAFGQGVDGYNSAFNSGLGQDYSSAFGRDIGNGYNSSFSRDLGSGFNSGVDLAKTYAGADDFSADRQRVEDALWQRGASARAQDDEALRTRLMNSGLREGSAAWNSEMERQARQVADERTGVLLAGGQEQSRLVGLAQQAAQFGNDASLAQAQFGNTAALQQAQYGREGQQAANAAALAQAQYGSAQQQAGNAAALAQGQFGAQQQQNQNAAAMGLAQYGREGQQAQNAAALGLAQYGQQAQQAGNAATLAQAQYGQQAQGLQNSAALAQGQYGNAANLQNAQFQNAARSQGLQEAYAARNQPLNEILGLLSGTQLQNPNFVNTNTAQIANTDVAGIIGNYDKQRMNAYQQQQQSLGGLIGGIGSGIGNLLGTSTTGTLLGGLMGYKG